MPSNSEPLFSSLPTPTPPIPGADGKLAPPGSLPTDRHGVFMSPGSSNRNKIQVVSKMTDCEGAKGPPLTAGLSWEALESTTDGGSLTGIS